MAEGRLTRMAPLRKLRGGPNSVALWLYLATMEDSAVRSRPSSVFSRNGLLFPDPGADRGVTATNWRFVDA
jgi:hypothetical protein